MGMYTSCVPLVGGLSCTPLYMRLHYCAYCVHRPVSDVHFDRPFEERWDEAQRGVRMPREEAIIDRLLLSLGIPMSF